MIPLQFCNWFCFNQENPPLPTQQPTYGSDEIEPIMTKYGAPIADDYSKPRAEMMTNHNSNNAETTISSDYNSPSPTPVAPLSTSYGVPTSDAIGQYSEYDDYPEDDFSEDEGEWENFSWQKIPKMTHEKKKINYNVVKRNFYISPSSDSGCEFIISDRVRP